MVEVTPRWEWRSFGRRFGEAESTMARQTPRDVQESDEIHLLSAAGDNVKVRDSLMDVKVLREVNSEGLERWVPVLKAGFPLGAPEVARVLVQGTVPDRAEIDRQSELYRSRDAEARRAIAGLQPKRAEVILAGACIVRAVMRKLRKDTLTVSDRGLRHGALVERFGSRTEGDAVDGRPWDPNTTVRPPKPDTERGGP